MKTKFFVSTIMFIMVISCLGTFNTTSIEIKDNGCSCTKTIENSQETYNLDITEEEIADLQNQIDQNGWSLRLEKMVQQVVR